MGQLESKLQYFMSTVDISKLVDGRNEFLWQEIMSKYEVKIEPSLNSEYSCYSKSNSVTFFVPINNFCSDSFTHELLHVYIRLKDVYIASNLILRVSASKVLSKIFNHKLLDHVGNCLDHIKMLPIYLQMGFKRDKFLLDYQLNKCSDDELWEIKNYFKNGNRYNTQAIALFIGKYFGAVADPNDTFDYSNCLIKLKKIDAILFLALEAFVDSWKKYDIDSNDGLNSYRLLVDKFYEDLKGWMTKKEFT